IKLHAGQKAGRCCKVERRDPLDESTRVPGDARQDGEKCDTDAPPDQSMHVHGSGLKFVTRSRSPSNGWSMMPKKLALAKAGVGPVFGKHHAPSKNGAGERLEGKPSRSTAAFWRTCGAVSGCRLIEQTYADPRWRSRRLKATAFDGRLRRQGGDGCARRSGSSEQGRPGCCCPTCCGVMASTASCSRIAAGVT